MPYIGQKPADIISTAVDTVTGKFSGEVDAASLDISGAIDVAGTTNLDVVDIDGVLTQDGGAVFNEASADVDFRVEGNTDTHALFVQGGSDHVGINNSSPNSQLTGADNLVIGNTGVDTTGMTFVGSGGSGSQGLIHFSDSDSGNARFDGFIGYEHTNRFLKFGTAQASRFTIDSGGRLGVTSHIDISGGIFLSSVGSGGIAIQSTATANHSYVAYKMRNSSGSEVGSIAVTNSGTAFNTSSDYRLKENVSYSFDATSRLKQLKPARFNFISDADITVDGFIAHEVSSIVPEAITGAKDATESMANVVLNADGTRLTDDVTQEKWVAGKLSTTDEDGNTVKPIYASDTTWVASQTVPKYQSIDQAKLVPLLTKALQEQQATIEALTARIVTLENA